MGVILVKLDMVSRAQEHYERALQLDPQYLDAQVSGIPAVAPG
jgi:tetratricopeptide (TPR) repeat protein